MPMIQARNPWGQLIDSQRSDLWEIDLTSVVKGLHGAAGSFPDLKTQELLKQDWRHHSFYATRVTLPTLSMENSVSYNGSMPVNLPGSDSAVGDAKIDFILEASDLADSYGQLNRLTKSRIYYTLMAWRGLARAGRYTEAAGDNFVAQLTSSRLSPTFQFDISVRLLAGMMKVTNQTTAASGSGFGDGTIPNLNNITEKQVEMAVTNSILLKKCWCRELSVSNLDYSNKGDPVIVSATVSCAAVKFADARGD